MPGGRAMPRQVHPENAEVEGWLAREAPEPVLEPDLPIVDAHLARLSEGALGEGEKSSGVELSKAQRIAGRKASLLQGDSAADLCSEKSAPPRQRSQKHMKAAVTKCVAVGALAGGSGEHAQASDDPAALIAE